jgi:hypothetical protein
MKTENSRLQEPKNAAQEMLVNADYQILDAAFDLDLFLKECRGLTDSEVRHIKALTNHISTTMSDLTNALMPSLGGEKGNE